MRNNRKMPRVTRGVSLWEGMIGSTDLSLQADVLCVITKRATVNKSTEWAGRNAPAVISVKTDPE
jgi:hypothetical protein